MLRLALTPRWLGWLALAVLVALACLWLGQWQWDKYEDRAARADRIEAHYEADPVPATEVLGEDPAAEAALTGAAVSTFSAMGAWLGPGPETPVAA